MSKKDNETNQTNQIFNFPISQLQIHILRYFKMIGWIGLVGKKVQCHTTVAAITTAVTPATSTSLPSRSYSPRSNGDPQDPMDAALDIDQAQRQQQMEQEDASGADDVD